jgi:hypothetical protein
MKPHRGHKAAYAVPLRAFPYKQRGPGPYYARNGSRFVHLTTETEGSYLIRENHYVVFIAVDLLIVRASSRWWHIHHKLVLSDDCISKGLACFTLFLNRGAAACAGQGSGGGGAQAAAPQRRAYLMPLGLARLPDPDEWASIPENNQKPANNKVVFINAILIYIVAILAIFPSRVSVIFNANRPPIAPKQNNALCTNQFATSHFLSSKTSSIVL